MADTKTANPKTVSPAPLAARSTEIKLTNNTSSTLILVSDSLKHGTWADNSTPPYKIAAGATATFQSESDGFMTGTTGDASYKIEGDETGTIDFSWDNPFMSKNSYTYRPPRFYALERVGDGTGNQASFVLVLSNDNKESTLPHYSSVKSIDLLDVWGEGRLTCDGNVTGFTTAYNLNQVDQKISNCKKGEDIPNLVPVDDYDDPIFPLDDGIVSYITLMGAPIVTKCAKEMYRVLDKKTGVIILFDPSDADKTVFEDALVNSQFILKKNDELRSPFNQIKIGANDRMPVYIYGFKGVTDKDEL